MTRSSLFDRRFVVINGKGGVGRSTVCAAIATAAARRGKRVLVCELNTKERIPSLLGARPVGHEITPVVRPGPQGAGGIWCVNIRPEHAMREYGLMKLRVRALYKVAFENRLVKGFLRLIPGLPELLMLGKAFFHEAELDPLTGAPRWDMVVVDAPATGHGFSLLRIPQVVLAVTRRGPMADDARRMQALLADPRRSSIHIVTLAEAMPVSEAIDLRHQLEELLGLPTGFVFLNAVRADPADEDLLLEMRALTAQDEALSPLRPLLDAGHRRARRAAIEAAHGAALRADVDMPVVELPFIAAERWGADEMERLSLALEAGVAEVAPG